MIFPIHRFLVLGEVQFRITSLYRKWGIKGFHLKNNSKLVWQHYDSVRLPFTGKTLLQKSHRGLIENSTLLNVWKSYTLPIQEYLSSTFPEYQLAVLFVQMNNNPKTDFWEQRVVQRVRNLLCMWLTWVWSVVSNMVFWASPGVIRKCWASNNPWDHQVWYQNKINKKGLILRIFFGLTI